MRRNRWITTDRKHRGGAARSGEGAPSRDASLRRPTALQNRTKARLERSTAWRGATDAVHRAPIVQLASAIPLWWLLALHCRLAKSAQQRRQQRSHPPAGVHRRISLCHAARGSRHNTLSALLAPFLRTFPTLLGGAESRCLNRSFSRCLAAERKEKRSRFTPLDLSNQRHHNDQTFSGS